MEFDTGRRRFLELAGTGTAVSIAGCSALQGDAETGTEATEAGTDGGADGTPEGGNEETVAVAVRADQQKLQQRQQELRSEVESGNISRSEAQQKARSVQNELRSEAVASFRERAGSNAGFAVDDAVGQFGILLVSGSPAALIDALSFSEVSALLPKDTFQRAKSQAEQRNGTRTTAN